MQRLNDDNSCPRCHIALKETLLENRAASWQMSCQQCNFLKFKCYCPKCNGCLETANPQEIADGFLLTCPSTDCKNKFQVIKCPHPQCNKFNFFNNGSYNMSELVKCKSCQTPFQQLTCPHCLESNYWRGDVDNYYAAGNATRCYACQRKFQHIQCPHCKQPKYFPNCEYISGIKQTCDSCAKPFQHTLCSACHTPNYYPQCNFKYGARQTCSNNQCKQIYEVIVCPDCGKENVFKDLFTAETKALKDYNCWSCKSKFSHCTCKFCNENIYPRPEEDFRIGANTIPCPSCKRNIPDFYKCPTCKKVLIDSKGCTCPPPVNPTPPLFNRPQSAQSSIFDRIIQTNNVQVSLFSGNASRPVSLFNPGPSSDAPPRVGSIFGNVGRNSESNQNNSLTSNNQTSSIFSSMFGPAVSQNNNNNNTSNNILSIQQLNVKSSTNKEQPKKEEVEVPQGLDEAKTCVICYTYAAEVAFIPCGHKKTCAGCSNKLMQGTRLCPICRVRIQQQIKIYD